MNLAHQAAALSFVAVCAASGHVLTDDECGQAAFLARHLTIFAQKPTDGLTLSQEHSIIDNLASTTYLWKWDQEDIKRWHRIVQNIYKHPEFDPTANAESVGEGCRKHLKDSQ